MSDSTKLLASLVVQHMQRLWKARGQDAQVMVEELARDFEQRARPGCTSVRAQGYIEAAQALRDAYQEVS